MSALDDANQALFIKALEDLSYSQFLGWIAMSMHSNDNSMSDYCATRLDLIALRIQVREVSE